MLRHTWTDPLSLCLALSLASLVLFAAGATNILAVVEAAGQTRTATLFSGPSALLQQGLWELAALVFATTAAAPLLLICASLYTLGGLWLQWPLPGLRHAFILRNWLRPWSMIEVFLVGYFVAYAKLGPLAYIEPGPAFYALFGLMVTTIAADALLDPQAVWEAIAQAGPAPARHGQAATSAAPGLVCCLACELACRPTGPNPRCPRCSAPLHRRKPGSIARTAALALSALVFYVPANVFPVLTVIRLGRGSPSTIFSGFWELLHAGQLPLAVIVFTASIAIPVLKIIALGAMLTVALRGRTGRLRHLTMLYRAVSVIGRWSMIDLFMESILSGLVQFGFVATVGTDIGAVAFATTVVLTILAAQSFDPRLMWDANERR